MRIRKATLRLIGLAVLVTLTAVVAGAALAAGGVTVLTPPTGVQDIYWDANQDGVHDAGEFVGTFPVYNGMAPITFSWPATSFPAGANGSYRVALWQNTNPLGAPVWQEVMVSHHWASNPNGPQFTAGPFGPGQVCVYCPSMFVIQPETFTQALDTTTGTYEYIYTPLAALLTRPAALEQSDPFILGVTDYSGEEEEEDEQGKSCCEKACSQREDAVTAGQVAADSECVAYCNDFPEEFSCAACQSPYDSEYCCVVEYGGNWVCGEGCSCVFPE